MFGLIFHNNPLSFAKPKHASEFVDFESVQPCYFFKKGYIWIILYLKKYQAFRPVQLNSRYKKKLKSWKYYLFSWIFVILYIYLKIVVIHSFPWFHSEKLGSRVEKKLRIQRGIAESFCTRQAQRSRVQKGKQFQVGFSAFFHEGTEPHEWNHVKGWICSFPSACSTWVNSTWFLSPIPDDKIVKTWHFFQWISIAQLVERSASLQKSWVRAPQHALLFFLIEDLLEVKCCKMQLPLHRVKKDS